MSHLVPQCTRHQDLSGSEGGGTIFESEKAQWPGRLDTAS
jgi:hypothetical protein